MHSETTKHHFEHGNSAIELFFRQVVLGLVTVLGHVEAVLHQGFTLFYAHGCSNIILLGALAKFQCRVKCFLVNGHCDSFNFLLQGFIDSKVLGVQICNEIFALVLAVLQIGLNSVYNIGNGNEKTAKDATARRWFWFCALTPIIVIL